MKPASLPAFLSPVAVAPHAGAWIETLPPVIAKNAESSPPMRGRGLKPITDDQAIKPTKVAPHAGAWIETCF